MSLLLLNKRQERLKGFTLINREVVSEKDIVVCLS